MDEALDLESLYKQAQLALEEGQQDRALQLLKQILAVDEEYKDAAKILATLVARQQRRWYRDQRTWVLLGIIFLAGLAFLSKDVIFEWLPQFFPKETASPIATVYVVNPTLTASPTTTSTPTLIPTQIPTPTSILLSWFRISQGQEFARDIVSAIIFDPSDPEVLYAGTENAGIYKSIDGGISWQPFHNGLGAARIHSLAIDPDNPRTLYTGVILAGVYKTIDGGEHWRAVNQGMDGFGTVFTSIVVISPVNQQHLFYTHGSRIYESTDGAGVWKDIQISECPSDIWGLVVHPTEPSTLFAVDEDHSCRGGVYKSSDDGRDWHLIAPLEHNQRLWIDPSTGQFLYSSAWSELSGSSDGGESWRTISSEFGCIAAGFQPDNGSETYCTTWYGAIMKTIDGGLNWEILNQLDVGLIRAIDVSPQDKDLIFIGGRGMNMSLDGGVTWMGRSSGLGGMQLELKLDPEDSSIFYAVEGSGEGSLYRSEDRGKQWERLEGQGIGLAFDADGMTLYRALHEGLLHSQDGGRSWISIETPVEGIQSVSSHPYHPGMLFFSHGPGQSPIIYVSTDGGSTWQGTSGINYMFNAKLFFDHDQGQVVYAVGRHDQVARSMDGGRTWMECAPTQFWHPETDTQLAIHPKDSNKLILATRGGGVLISKDGCQSWQSINEGLGNLFVNTVTFDPLNPRTIYVGTDGGVYISYDSGEHWGVVNEGLLGATVIYSIMVDPQDSKNVYAATPYGIFKLVSR